MKPLLTLAAALALAGSLAAAPKVPEVLVSGDALSSAPVALRPEPGKPIYYLLLGSAEVDLGARFGHMPSPDRKAMEAALVKTLAQQGFILAKAGDPMPQIALAVSWGTVSIDDIAENGKDPFVENKIKDPPDHFEEEVFERVHNENRKHMWRITGALKSDGYNLSLVESDKLSAAVGSDRVYLSVLAFDMPALIKKQKVLLWRTHMSVDVLESTLPESFDRMFADAAPYFGRSTDKPIIIDDRARNAKATFGELKVLEFDVKPADTKSNTSERKKVAPNKSRP